MVILHLAGWMIFFVLPILLSPPGELEATFRETSNLESLALRNLLLMAFFYLNYLYLAPRLIRSRGMGQFLLVIIPIIVGVSLANWDIHHSLSEPMPGPSRSGPREDRIVHRILSFDPIRAADQWVDLRDPAGGLCCWRVRCSPVC